ncbi:hypothetical protein GINT2_001374 [Glugoides intestinalis]
MPSIKQLYRSNSENIKEDIEQYVRSTKDFKDEIEAFKELLNTAEFDKALFVFYAELLAQAIKKPADLNAFFAVLFPFLEENMNMKTSIIVLRALKGLSGAKFFLPISFYFTKLMKIAMEVKNLKKLGKRMSYNNVKISLEEAGSEELQMFIIQECVINLKRHCQAFGNSIGFPEFAVVVCNELKAQCKVKIYKEMIGELIQHILKRKSYIEEERNRLGINACEAAKVVEFEKGLKAWVQND